MRFSPILALHILAGIAALLAGTVAMAVRKGADRHRLYGNIFVVAMLALGLSAAYIAYFQTHDPGNLTGGLFTVYLVATAWLTARRPAMQLRAGKSVATASLPGMRLGDALGFCVALAGGSYLVYAGLQVWKLPHHVFRGVPAQMLFFLATIALLCAAGDLRMILRGGLLERARIARHLWRMCFALFIATGSFFLGRIRIFPMWVRDAYIPFALAVLPLFLLIYWLVRVRITGKRKPAFVTASV